MKTFLQQLNIFCNGVKVRAYVPNVSKDEVHGLVICLFNVFFVMNKNWRDHMDRKKMSVPIWEKLALTVEETAEYSNIGQNRISNLLKEPRCPFVLYAGNKKLVKRKEFERFISEAIEI